MTMDILARIAELDARAARRQAEEAQDRATLAELKAAVLANMPSQPAEPQVPPAPPPPPSVEEPPPAPPPPPPVVQPAVDPRDMAFGGLFYGCGASFEAIGNKQIRAGNAAATAFVMPYDDEITHILQNSRVNKAGETGYGGGQCDAWLSFHRDAGGMPDFDKMIGRTDTWVPAKSAAFPLLALRAPAKVSRGEIIWVVWHNDTKATGEANYYSANFGIVQKPLPHPQRMGPAYPFLKTIQTTNGWKSTAIANASSWGAAAEGAYVPFLEFRFKSGRAYGQPYRFANRGECLVDGDKLIRQTFKMPAYTVEVDGFWTRGFSQADKPQIGAELRFLESPTILAEGMADPGDITIIPASVTIPSAYFGNPRGNPKGDSAKPHRWFFTKFSRVVPLQAYKSYSLTLRAPYRQGAWFWPMFSGVKQGGFKCLEAFLAHPNTQSEFSRDGGKSFDHPNINNGGTQYNDWPFLFRAVR
ncbi:MAG TPA: hypothetical protein VNS22_01970 [Geminicoccus sp.]|nr:hypothetical protein [Geminicoccus sp.]